MELLVDRELCIGAAQCVLAAPEFFDQSDDDGLVIAPALSPDEQPPTAVLEAVRLCPSGALSVVRRKSA